MHRATRIISSPDRVRPTPVRGRQLSTTGPLSTVPDQDPHAGPDCVTVDPCDSNDSDDSKSSKSSKSGGWGQGLRPGNGTFDDVRDVRRERIDRRTYERTYDTTDRTASDRTTSGPAAMARAAVGRAAGGLPPRRR
ncbi:hypothetical protein HEK616_54160 [Streptomyces nigrescens]|uniref:Uncharacterized protein n=1 Tax=Streptomyces nigrescens TaxID=1920 RepID=A0ABM7ZZW6_STRNI|nr:hypothetical protein HEK616_54160 [Streptomyces nigrescens]